MIVKSTMRQAFEGMKITANSSSKIVNAAVKAATHHAGEYRRREWDAHLKFGTYQKLHKGGVL